MNMCLWLLRRESSLLVQGWLLLFVMLLFPSYSDGWRSASRGRGAQSIQMNDSDPVSRLEGLEMFPLDWHVKMNLLEVRMFKLIYTFEILAMFSLHLACMEILLYQPAASEHGTLNVIGRTNVTNPKSRFDACEDFFVLVTESYILVSAMTKFQMKSLEESPNIDIVPENVWLCSKEERKQMINDLSEELVDSYVDFSFCNPNKASNDQVKQHTIQLLSLGLFYLNFHDAIKEGDGEWVLRSWRYMLPIFIATGRENYAKEALLFIVQCSFSFSQRIVQ